MELTSFENGEISFSVEGSEIRYERNHANQLILCARMNDWDRFTAMWKRKTDPATWEKWAPLFSKLDTGGRWKIKETFARLATVEEETASSKALKTISL